MRIGQLLGQLFYWLAPRRKNIVAVNLRLCFPEWNNQLLKAKIKEVLVQNALGLIETANAYHKPLEHYAGKVEVAGLDLLEAAKSKHKGVLLLGAHFSHLDLGGALTSLYTEVDAIYRPHNNPLMDRYINKYRSRFMSNVISRNDMRSIARALKNNEVVWYPPDQDYGSKHAVYAPFFGINAATITATSRLTKFNHSPVLMVSYRRDPKRERYQLEFTELVADFPTGDDITDATIINKTLEREIRKAPTQYMWTHRRFKTQPDAKGALYR